SLRRSASGSPPARAIFLNLMASSRASARDTSESPPRPMSHRFPWTSVRNIQRFAPDGSTTKYNPLPSAYRPGSITFLTLVADNAFSGYFLRFGASSDSGEVAIFRSSLHPTLFVGFQHTRAESDGQRNCSKSTSALHRTGFGGPFWTASRRIPE